MLRLANGYSSTVWAMIEWYHPNCPDGGDWEKKGWWQIEPGQSKVVFGDDVNDVDRYWYFFAHAADGTVWSGPFEETVPDRAFSWCENTADTSSRTVGMQQLDVDDNENHTLNLVPG